MVTCDKSANLNTINIRNFKGTIGKSVLGHNNLVLVERPSAKEDSFNIEKIKENKLGISIEEKDLSTIDIQSLENELKNNIDYEKLHTYKNDVDKIVELILA